MLVVGSGHSGCLIAEDIHLSGTKAFLAAGRVKRLPRRYRGKDIIEWWEMAGLLDLTPEQLPPGMGKFDAIPQFSQNTKGHYMNLHLMAKDGISLLGHIRSASGHVLQIAPDLHETLQMADQFEREACGIIDGLIQSKGLEIPPEDLPQYDYAYQQPLIEELDLRQQNISTIIWATGYKYDYGIVKLPVFDIDNFPVQNSGETKFPGLYFVGLPWMPSQRSGFLAGVSEAAKHVASLVMRR